MLQCDVLVVGAGPAGCAAALTAQRLGLDVLVIDKAIFPRDKCCGDGLTTLALRELEQLGFEPNISSWVNVEDVFLRSPAGREIRLALPNGQGQYAAVVKRMELDAELVRLVANSGVQVHQGLAFDQIEINISRLDFAIHKNRFSPNKFHPMSGGNMCLRGRNHFVART